MSGSPTTSRARSVEAPAPEPRDVLRAEPPGPAAAEGAPPARHARHRLLQRIAVAIALALWLYVLGSLLAILVPRTSPAGLPWLALAVGALLVWSWDLMVQFAFVVLSVTGWWWPARIPARRAPEPLPALPARPPIAVIYCTADDFEEEAVLALLQLRYEAKQVFIFDNGRSDAFRARIDAFASRHPVEVVRRRQAAHGKAGNLNHGLSRIASRFPLYAVFDSDSYPRSDFLDRCVEAFQDPWVAFTQGRLAPRDDDDEGLARHLRHTLTMIYDGVVPAQQTHGICMCYGHGTILRTDVWRRIGGYPVHGAEDEGFVLAARTLGYYGWYCHDAICRDRYPPTVAQYLKRMEKWVRGVGNTFRVLAPAFLRSPHVDPIEKIDLARIVVQLGNAALALVMMLALTVLCGMHPGMGEALRREGGALALFLVFAASLVPSLLVFRGTRGRLTTVLAWNGLLFMGTSLRNLIDVLSVAIARSPVFNSTSNPDDAGFVETDRGRRGWWARPKAMRRSTALISASGGWLLVFVGFSHSVLWLIPWGLSILSTEILCQRLRPRLAWAAGLLSMATLVGAFLLILVTNTLDPVDGLVGVPGADR